jgi:hypothetical protein
VAAHDGWPTALAVGVCGRRAAVGDGQRLGMGGVGGESGEEAGAGVHWVLVLAGRLFVLACHVLLIARCVLRTLTVWPGAMCYANMVVPSSPPASLYPTLIRVLSRSVG